MSKNINILDGGFGQAIINKGLDQIGTLWGCSAYLNEKDHQKVIDTHLEFIKAGSKMITTSNFTIRKRRLAQNKLENRLNNFKNKLLSNHDNKKLILNEIKSLSKELSSLDDGGKMKSYLHKIKRKFKKKTVKIDRVMKDFDNLIKIYNKKAKWLDKADSKLRNQVQSLLNETAYTIGSRNQKKLPRETALFIAKCNSGHKDISLNF